MRRLYIIAAILTAGHVFTPDLAAQVSVDLAAQKKSSWKLICADGLKRETCRITQTHFVRKKDIQGKQQTGSKILGLTVIYVPNPKSKIREPYLSIQMPLGVDLRRGAALRVDKGKEIPVRYLRCTNSGCDASLKLDSGILKALKAGNGLLVGFLPWGTNKTTVVGATLKGFTKAFKAIK
jgi:invasion protein IalB